MPGTESTLIQALLNCLNQNKGITVVAGQQKDHFLSYDELYRKACAAKSVFEHFGIKKGTDVIIQIADPENYLIAFWAGILGGFQVIPLSAGYNDENIQKLVKLNEVLHEPYYFCESDAFESVLKALDLSNAELSKTLLQQAIFIDKIPLTDSHERHAPIVAEDLAYIQFSSGSTGDPKGVMLTHENLVANTQDIISRSKIVANDRLLSWMPLTHDMGLICFHLTAVVAAIDQIIIPTHLFIRRPTIWLEKCSKHRATHLYSPNFGYQYLLTSIHKLDKGLDLSSVKLIYNGAEPISVALCQRFVKTLSPWGLSDKVIYPGYGLAEASVAVTLPLQAGEMTSISVDRHQLNVDEAISFKEDGLVFSNVGRPIEHCEVRIADDHDAPLPEAYVGHIQIRGKNVTKGYYNNTVATDSLFTEDGWLKTGDLGFFNEDLLYITGRSKQIIIFNGQNYYPHDIENCCHLIEGLAPGKVAAVAVRNDISQSDELAVFVVDKKPASAFNSIALKIRDLLLDKMGLQVSWVVPVRQLPKTTSGKVQYYKLIQNLQNGRYANVQKLKIEGHGPSGSTRIRDLADQVFGTRFQWNVPFFEQGISSLQLMNFTLALQEAGYDVTPITLFEVENLEALLPLIKENEVTDENHPAGEVVLNSAQRRLWSLQEYYPEEVNLILRSAHVIEGEFEYNSFYLAFQYVVERHPLLRSSFQLRDGSLVTEILPMPAQDDYTTYFEGEVTMENALSQGHELADQGFNLENGPLLKAGIWRLGTDKILFFFWVHHLVFDGWSFDIFIDELKKAYHQFQEDQTVRPTLPQPPYGRHQKQVLHHQNRLREEGISFWRSQVTDLPDSMLTALEKKEPTKAIKIEVQCTEIDAKSFISLKTLARQLNVSLFVLILSVLKLLFFRVLGKDDLAIFTSNAGRSYASSKELIGYFLQLMVFRSSYDSKQSFHELVQIIQQQLIEGIRYESFSFDDFLAEEKGAIAAQESIELLVLYQNFQKEFKINAWDEKTVVTPVELEYQSLMTKVQFEFFEHSDQLTLKTTYNSNLIDSQSIEALLDSFSTLLQGILKDPNKELGNYSFLNHSVSKKLKLWSGKGVVERAFVPVTQRIFSGAKAHALRPALHSGLKTVSYRELDEEIQQIAIALQHKYLVRKGDRIVLDANRSEHQLMITLAVLHIGACYVPVDTDHPVNRVLGIASDCVAKYIISSRHFPESEANNIISPKDLIDTDIQDKSFLTSIINAHDTAYIMYTSGTSGKPKGVVVSHGALANYTQTFIDYFKLTADDRVLQQASVSFDTFVEEVFPALVTGSAVFVAPNGGKNIAEVAELISEQRLTIISSTPLVLQELNKQVEIFQQLRVVISGGDMLLPAAINNFLDRVEVYNTYGPTETTVCATYHRVKDPGTSHFIGKPLDHVQVAVLNEHLNPVPPNITGELFIGGVGLAAGYLNQVELTNEKYPFLEGRRWYRTGDLVRWKTAGDLEYISRSDDQVKIRGSRVELQEVEAALLKNPEIKQCAVVVHSGSRGIKYLIAFITVKEEIDEDKAMQALVELIPTYMVPSQLVTIDELPMTVNGKIDKQKLRQIGLNQHLTPQKAVNEIEAQLIEIFSEVLSIPPEAFGTNHNFFELGGNSIHAIRIVSLIQKRLSIDVVIRSVFTFPTISRLSVVLSNSKKASSDALNLGTLPSEIPLSFSQERLWFKHQLYGSVDYHLSSILELDASIDLALIKKSFHTLVDRHQILRTVFYQKEGTPYQKVLQVNDWDLPVQKPEPTYTKNEREDAIRSIILQPFVLEKDLPIRTVLIEESSGKFLVIVLHHIATDGWSRQTLVREWLNIYHAYSNQSKITLPETRLQYADFANWERNTWKVRPSNEGLRYWQKELKSLTPTIITTDFPRPTTRRFLGDSMEIEFPQAIAQQIIRLSQENSVTVFAFMLAAFKVLLSRYTGNEDVSVGSPIANRSHDEFAGMVGFFVNTLILRSDLSDDPDFKSLLLRVSANLLFASDHSDVPFEMIAENFKESDQGNLLSILFTVEETSAELDDLLLAVGLKEHKIYHRTSQVDLTCFVRRQGDEISLLLEYDTDLYEKETISRFASHYQQLIFSISNDISKPISELSILTESEERNWLKRVNRNFEVSEESLLGLFKKWVLTGPDRTAIVYRERKMTYEELDQASNQVAHALISSKVAASEVIGLCADRSFEMIIGIIGILKAGCCYLPLDPTFPADRIAHMLADSRARIVLSTQPTKVLFDEEIEVIDLNQATLSSHSVNDLPDQRQAQSEASVMYTSGSTGAPKGIIVEDHNILDLVRVNEGIGISPDDCVLQWSNFVFDGSVYDIFCTLLRGAKLCLIDKKHVADPIAIADEIRASEVSVCFLTTALFNSMVEFGLPGLKSLRKVLFGGEQYSIDHVRQAFEALGPQKIVHVYGPTESTVFATFYCVDRYPEHSVPIGQGLGQRDFLVMNGKSLTPVGMVGELYIAGEGLSRGYMNRIELTTENFVQYPKWTNQRLYRTGDLVRLNKAGELEYVGRRDEQVKVRGYRVELAEIEHVLTNLEEVVQAVVLALPGDDGVKKLVGYVALQPGETWNQEELIGKLKIKLPDYMVPGIWQQVEAIPLNRNGKVDKQTLPKVSIGESTERIVSPTNDLERHLREIWSEILVIPEQRISVTANFFELGGHSLLAVKVLNRIQQHLEVNLDMQTLFEHYSIRSLGTYIDLLKSDSTEHHSDSVTLDLDTLLDQ